MDCVSVVPVRNARNGGVEVFLLQDQGSPRCWFPNGSVRDADATARSAARCYGVSMAAAREALDPRKAPLWCLAHWIAASRELFVHTGVLFCTDRKRRNRMAVQARPQFITQRPLLARRELEFRVLLEAAGVFCNLGRLLPFAKWVDDRDGSEPVRLQVFLAGLSKEDRARSSPPDRGHWRTPGTAMVEWQQGQISLDFTTFGCLRTLADFPDIESLFSEYGRWGLMDGAQCW